MWGDGFLQATGKNALVYEFYQWRKLLEYGMRFLKRTKALAPSEARAYAFMGGCFFFSIKNFLGAPFAHVLKKVIPPTKFVGGKNY